MNDYTFLTAEEFDLFLSAITDDTLREKLGDYYLHTTHLICTLLAGKASFEKLGPYFLAHPGMLTFLQYMILDEAEVEITYPDDNSARWRGNGKTVFHVDVLSERPVKFWTMTLDTALVALL